ncbi:hypothetical protein ACFQL7_20700 [Halocatena marina]|uniref:Uncharacterized protein n=1 Tax=Halocatena marina TaxID=2934937 RepID=A0ABD5YLE0_9EURY|nr:hypothetical protein [Halocatena marina]
MDKKLSLVLIVLVLLAFAALGGAFSSDKDVNPENAAKKELDEDCVNCGSVESYLENNTTTTERPPSRLTGVIE